jgi:hypothetical protein
VLVLLWAGSKLAARWASQTTMHAADVLCPEHEAPTTLLRQKQPSDSTDKCISEDTQGRHCIASCRRCQIDPKQAEAKP